MELLFQHQNKNSTPLAFIFSKICHFFILRRDKNTHMNLKGGGCLLALFLQPFALQLFSTFCLASALNFALPVVFASPFALTLILVSRFALALVHYEHLTAQMVKHHNSWAEGVAVSLPPKNRFLGGDGSSIYKRITRAKRANEIH